MLRLGSQRGRKELCQSPHKATAAAQHWGSPGGRRAQSGRSVSTSLPDPWNHEEMGGAAEPPGSEHCTERADERKGGRESEFAVAPQGPQWDIPLFHCLAAHVRVKNLLSGSIGKKKKKKGTERKLRVSARASVKQQVTECKPDTEAQGESTGRTGNRPVEITVSGPRRRHSRC